MDFISDDEEDEDNGPTVDDIIAEVKKVKSKIGTLKHPLLYRRKTASIASRSTTKEIINKKNATDKVDTKNSLHCSREGWRPIREVDCSETGSTLRGNSDSQLRAKLSRSISTPELNFKFKTGAQSVTKPSVVRRVEFGSLAKGHEREYEIYCEAEKENFVPVALPSHGRVGHYLKSQNHRTPFFRYGLDEKSVLHRNYVERSSQKSEFVDKRSLYADERKSSDSVGNSNHCNGVRHLVDNSLTGQMAKHNLKSEVEKDETDPPSKDCFQRYATSDSIQSILQFISNSTKPETSGMSAVAQEMVKNGVNPLKNQNGSEAKSTAGTFKMPAAVCAENPRGSGGEVRSKVFKNGSAHPDAEGGADKTSPYEQNKNSPGSRFGSTPNLFSAELQMIHSEDSEIVCVCGQKFLKLKKLGQGGSSVVYEVLDLKTKDIRALKIVELSGQDPSTLTGYRNEIKLLERLRDSDKIIKIYCYEENEKNLKIVMEVGEVDLASIINNLRTNKKRLPAFTVRHYWQAMLQAVQVIHKEGIIHSDIKPANFLSVKGSLKLIDFGIASSIQQDMTSVLKDNKSGTFNYMSPESLNDVSSGPIYQSTSKNRAGIKIGVKSDVWSLGCILYNLVYGSLPFQHLTNVMQKLCAISNPNTIIQFPPHPDKNLLDVLKRCLRFDPRERPTIEELLVHPYLTEEEL